MSRIPAPKRLPLIVFAAIIVALFVGFWVAEGLGKPSIPGDAVAIVEDEPGGTLTVSKEDFDHALAQAAARAGVKKVPKPGTSQYDNLKEAAMNDLFDQAWIQGEAAEQGISATDQEVASQLKQIKQQNFRTEAEFKQFLKRSGFTPEDVDTRVRLQIYSNDIQQQVLKAAPAVSNSEVTDYYNASKAQFEQPETRDVRLILNKDKAKVDQAKAALEKDSSDASWKKVAKQYSTDPASRSNGGLRPSVTEGLLEQPLDKEIFGAQPRTLVGPIHTPLGYYVFEVEKVTAARTQPLNRAVRSQIKQQLTQQDQQNAFSAFVDDYGSKWQSRTFCAPGYVVQRCSNFKGSAHPANAPPRCYAKDARLPDACPAPVTQLAPAQPGTVSIISPQGTRLPQRPVPAGLQAPSQQGLPGAVPGAPGSVGTPSGAGGATAPPTGP